MKQCNPQIGLDSLAVPFQTWRKYPCFSKMNVFDRSFQFHDEKQWDEFVRTQNLTALKALIAKFVKEEPHAPADVPCFERATKLLKSCVPFPEEQVEEETFQPTRVRRGPKRKLEDLAWKDFKQPQGRVMTLKSLSLGWSNCNLAKKKTLLVLLLGCEIFTAWQHFGRN